MRLGWNEDRERREKGPSFSFEEMHDPEGELLEKSEWEESVVKEGVPEENAPATGETSDAEPDPEDERVEGDGGIVGEEEEGAGEEPADLDTEEPPLTPEEVCDEIEEYEGEEAPEGEAAVDWHYEKGKELAACGRVHEAVEAYRQVLNLDPLHVKARNNLALVYDSLGLFDKACEELRTALDLDTRNVEVRANLGALLGEHGKFEEAEREFKRALDLAPDEPRIRFNLGLVYFRKGLYARAIPEFERTLALQEDHGEALYYLAQSYNLTGQYQLSLERFEALVNFDPGNHRAFWYLGMLCDRLKDYDRAREYYQTSYRLKQSDSGREERR